MKHNLWHPILGIIGMAAWILFILACVGWSPWSPDGSKIVFLYTLKARDQMGLAIYDRDTRTLTPIFILPIDEGDKHNEGLFPQSQWTSDGSRILVSLYHHTEMEFLVLNRKPGVPLRYMSLPIKEKGNIPIGPFPELEGAIYFVAGRSLARLNLASGAFDTNDFEGEQQLLPFVLQGELLYVRQKDAGKPPTEFGTIHRNNLTLHRLFETGGEELVPDIQLRVASHPAGKQFAMVARGKETDALFLFTQEGLNQTIVPKGLPEKFHFGNLQWSKDGTIIYALVLSPTSKENVSECSLAEIHLDGSSTGLTKLTQILESELEYWLEISLSPDGGTIAFDPSMYTPPEIDEGDHALFLIDVRGSDRTITKIFPPSEEARQNPAAAKD